MQKDRSKFLLWSAIAAVLVSAVIILKWTPGVSGYLWSVSHGGSWLLPLVVVSAFLDSVHPCSFSILLITIAFLFAMNMARGKILRIGGLYIGGIFLAYFLIGLGLLRVLHIFNTPHFMGKLGAALLVGFGILNLLNYFLPNFPIKLQIPSVSHEWMGKLIEKAGYAAAFALGVLVGICQFPCMGGPYLMVIGLLKDQTTYAVGFGYLFLYNTLLVLPLVAVLFVAADKLLLSKVETWKKENLKSVRLWAGLIMIGLGILVVLI